MCGCNDTDFPYARKYTSKGTLPYKGDTLGSYSFILVTLSLLKMSVDSLIAIQATEENRCRYLVTIYSLVF